MTTIQIQRYEGWQVSRSILIGVVSAFLSILLGVVSAFLYVVSVVGGSVRVLVPS